MMKLKAFAVGLIGTAASVAVIFYVVKRFAPPQVQNVFRV